MPDRHAEGLGHSIRRDVVMGGANSTRREHIAVAVAERVHGIGDLVLEDFEGMRKAGRWPPRRST
jgi:hypothetical protein